MIGRRSRNSPQVLGQGARRSLYRFDGSFAIALAMMVAEVGGRRGSMRRARRPSAVSSGRSPGGRPPQRRDATSRISRTESPQRVNIRAAVDQRIWLADGLLGASCIVRVPGKSPVIGDTQHPPATSRHPEVGDPEFAAQVDQEIGRLDIAVCRRPGRARSRVPRPPASPRPATARRYARLRSDGPPARSTGPARASRAARPAPLGLASERGHRPVRSPAATVLRPRRSREDSRPPGSRGRRGGGAADQIGQAPPRRIASRSRGRRGPGPARAPGRSGSAGASRPPGRAGTAALGIHRRGRAGLLKATRRLRATSWPRRRCPCPSAHFAEDPEAAERFRPSFLVLAGFRERLAAVPSASSARRFRMAGSRLRSIPAQAGCASTSDSTSTAFALQDGFVASSTRSRGCWVEGLEIGVRPRVAERSIRQGAEPGDHRPRGCAGPDRAGTRPRGPLGARIRHRGDRMPWSTPANEVPSAAEGPPGEIGSQSTTRNGSQALLASPRRDLAGPEDRGRW